MAPVHSPNPVIHSQLQQAALLLMMCLCFIKPPVIAVSTAGVVQAQTLAVEVAVTARLGILDEVVKGSRQQLANSLWAMPTLNLLISRRLHAAVAKAMQDRGVDCKAQGDQQHLLGSCQTV